jgi:predicted nucleotidyltransferase
MDHSPKFVLGKINSGSAISFPILSINMLNVPFEKMQHYIATAQARKQQRLVSLRQRQEQGLEIAQAAAKILKSEFAVDRVVVFGSLLGDNFHENSDIDLAVWGLAERNYFRAVAQLLSLSDFDVDLIEVQFASEEILEAIAQGREL